MDSATIGLIGGIAGGVIGLIGGAVGIYFSIKNTNGPRERAFMIRATLIFLSLFVVVGVLWWLLPQPYKVLAFVPFWVIVPFAIRALNRRQMTIRQQEAQNRADSALSDSDE